MDGSLASVEYFEVEIGMLVEVCKISKGRVFIFPY